MAGNGRPVDVRVDDESLRELVKALRAIDKQGPKDLRKGLREAAKIVTDATRPKVARQSGKAANSYKPQAQSDGARIAFGGKGREYVPWLDFGGTTGRGHQTLGSGGGAIVRPFIPEGRYLYPTIAEKGPEVMAHLDALYEDLFQRYGVETKGRADRR